MEIDSMNEPEIIRALRGVRRIVINNCHGGFGLSWCGRRTYLEITDTPFHIRDQKNSNWQDDGPQIWVAGNMWDDHLIARDDPALVWVVENMGTLAAGKYSRFKVVDIPWDVDWIIQDYDGNEWIAESHRTWQ